ncbi:TetR/AcrR family transcriptional regulator [Microbispora sp. RL4-1S]|uniref:TetR/AcrR family transcriptional regulator n=1 Tax=Microbispora oryzae TaxID=2806554 RepID=A0A940WDD9_9ACTN|nr:TetR/AcrR family transcriptional regulator [Microbispora oryzae]
MRADARHNRARVLEAAEVVLARDGLSASIRAIARHAGVGLGTIYRHFPTQEALYQAVIIERAQRLVAEADALTVADDPGRAFFEFFTRIVENSTRNKTLADILTRAGLDPKAGTADISRDMRDAVERLLVRAQEAGAVREDLRMPELLALLGAACMAAERNQWDDELRTRTLTIVFDGLRPTGRHPASLLPPDFGSAP